MNPDIERAIAREAGASIGICSTRTRWARRERRGDMDTGASPGRGGVVRGTSGDVLTGDAALRAAARSYPPLQRGIAPVLRRDPSIA